ncbi:hypothetical protein [Mycolicibacterium moriokaense]|uniref:Uncharacterized protein n=1 Tax=Mycolicibacterium moriokaense TaxID=39691 RepID=A0A318HJI8_9MYCO|nr:hypothetical protein [Mycolicibacterium moriokaense]PXX01524.1 hypothetical protein C8E89_12810 [Mycolicibacterium moriokaense]
MTQPKQPPPGVETAPQGPVVPLQEAVAQLGKDPRTLMRAITDGRLRGGAIPRRERLRWYVYADELPSAAVTAATPPAANVQDLRAQVVSLSEANRLLIAAQQELLDADRATNDAAEKYRAVARNYLDALAQFMTPGHLGDMADL